MSLFCTNWQLHLGYNFHNYDFHVLTLDAKEKIHYYKGLFQAKNEKGKSMKANT